MSDLKTSILINRQLPEFIREEYPQFIAFLEAYYEFLETKQGTNLNDVLKVSKDARYFTDIDKSLDQFEDQFFNTFIPLLSKNALISKDFLIKNVLPLYLSKGSKESFILLFKLLFNEEPKIIYPKDFILRASDGRWNIPKILRIFKNIASLHEGDGESNSFTIIPTEDLDSIIVFKNNTLQIQDVDYYIRKELNKIYFYETPNQGDQIVVEYEEFDFRIIENRKLISEFTRLESLIESVSFKKIGVDTYYEVFLKEDFEDKIINGEFVFTDVFVNGDTVNLRLKTVSDLDSIEILSPGTNYTVGEPVLIIGPAIRQATAVVDSVTEFGEIISIRITDRGTGYTVTPEVDLTVSGDGNASAKTSIRNSFIKLPGNWTTTDSLLSSDRVLQGRDYYTDFTYVISSKIEFSRYKDLFKQLVHPAGFKQYAQFDVEDFVVVTDKITSQLKKISANVLGTVNINSSIYVVGTNTQFLSVQDTGFLFEGQYILVNSEIRIVNSVINNTLLTVSEPFETTANGQTLVLVYAPYESITTESWIEITSSNDDELTTEKGYEAPPIYFSTDEY
jgi:hypothetical protein